MVNNYDFIRNCLLTNAKCFYLIESKDEALLGVDMVICIGGDGTLLYTSSMFQVITV